MKKAHIAGIGFSIIFGFSFMFSKVALDYVTPMGLIAYRFLLAFLVFEFLRLIKVVKIRWKWNVIRQILLVAFFQPILYFIFETFGLNMTSSSEAGMMIALIPIFVTILSAFILKEKATKAQVFFIIFSVAGIIFIQLFKPNNTSPTSYLGLILLFFAVISAASFNIASRNASKKVTPYENTYFMMFTGAVAFNLIYIIQLITKGNLASYYESLLHIELLGPIAYLGVIASIGGFFLVNYALSKLPAHVSSIYANLSTVVAVIAGALILGETIQWYHIVGGIMVVSGVYGTAFVNYKQRVSQVTSND